MAKNKGGKNQAGKGRMIKGGRVTRPRTWPAATSTPALRPKPQSQQPSRPVSSNTPTAPQKQPQKAST